MINPENARSAAEQANKLFGQWMPERWLNLFIDSYNDISECRSVIADVAQPTAMRQALEAIARTTFSGGDIDNDYMRGNRDAHATCARIAKAALAAQPPAAPVEGERKTFTIPPGYEAVRDSEGRATGEVRPRSSAATSELNFDDPVTSAIMGAARLHTHDHDTACRITRDALATITTLPQPTPHPDDVVNFNGRLVTWAEIDDAIRKRNAALSRPGRATP